ncbi:hypothetical protein HPB48_010044 [Haemaphysalis longicornis]|uniref:Uncharacterized protein n=1 Tax=Haemaphysalis longicornis TaxID=44386 RepID=A0A9J6GNF3_HAELO|nr:hypothetical protein HPB48_010044 [Haemaphysalis longicornis]
MINQNGGLTVCEKFNYLRLFFKGKDASSARGLPTTEACYRYTYPNIKRRFGDKTQVEQAYFARLRMLSPVKTSSDTVGLRKLYDYVLVNIRDIETLGVRKSSCSSMLCDIISRALPHDMDLGPWTFVQWTFVLGPSSNTTARVPLKYLLNVQTTFKRA